MEQAGGIIENVTLQNIGILSSIFSPFDVIFRYMISVIFFSIGMSTPLFDIQTNTNTTPSKWMFIYIYIYIIGLVMLAVRIFNKKDIA